MDPNKVISPMRRWNTVRIIHDGGPDGHSVALGFWDREPVIGTRWNGPDGSLGHPTSFAYAVWFIQPREFWEGILTSGLLSNEDIRMARLFLGLDEDEAEAAE